jgi:tRNA 2-thiouridine synthesizing protein E
LTAQEGNQDLRRMEAKLDALSAQVAQLVAAQDRLSSFYDDFAPIATKAMGVGAGKLDELDRKGYFTFAREALTVVDNVIAGYTPEDVHAFADNVVRMLDLVRRMTQPEVLDVAEHAAEAAQEAGEQEPPGVLGILKATSRDEEVRRGLMVALAVLRQIGRGAHAPPTTAVARINPLLGNKRNLSAPALRPAAAPAPTPAPAAAGAPPPPVHDAFVEDWTHALAQVRADQLGVGPLTDRHLLVLEFARTEYGQTGASPNIRRLTAGSGIPTKELYALFPRAPARAAAHIAGIPKPVGCI